MDAVSAAVTTGVIVTIGRWSQGKGLEANVVIGGGVYAMMLGALWNGNAELGSKMATLVLVSAVLIYMVPISSKLGFTPIGSANAKKMKFTQGTSPTSPSKGIA